MKRELHSIKNNDEELKNTKYKILIIGNKDRFIHLKQFSIELEKKGNNIKLIHDLDFSVLSPQIHYFI